MCALIPEFFGTLVREGLPLSPRPGFSPAPLLVSTVPTRLSAPHVGVASVRSVGTLGSFSAIINALPVFSCFNPNLVLAPDCIMVKPST